MNDDIRLCFLLVSDKIRILQNLTGGRSVFQTNNTLLLYSVQGVLSEWSEWSYCKPDCGPDSAQTREKKCLPDISEYR